MDDKEIKILLEREDLRAYRNHSFFCENYSQQRLMQCVARFSESGGGVVIISGYTEDDVGRKNVEKEIAEICWSMRPRVYPELKWVDFREKKLLLVFVPQFSLRDMPCYIP